MNMIVQDKERNQIITISVFILAVVAVAFALYFTRPRMIPFILALFIRIRSCNKRGTQPNDFNL